MIKLCRRLMLAAMMALLFLAPTVARAELYYAPTLVNMIRLLIRLGSADVNDDNIIDLYGRAAECAIYKKYALDQFKWHKIRQALRESVQQNIATFPTTLRFEASMQLGHYDFQKRIFRLSEKTAQFNVNVFTLDIQHNNFCTTDPIDPIPSTYQMVLDKPILIEGIPLNEKDANDLADRMKKNGNKDLIIYSRFNMRAMYVPKLADNVTNLPQKKDANDDLSKKKVQIKPVFLDKIRVDAKLDSIEFYEDPERSKLIYRIIP